MGVRYVYNTAGEYVAFVAGQNLFAPDCTWLGFLRPNGEVYSSQDASFLGHLTNDDRLIRSVREPARLKPLKPLTPPSPLVPLRPMRRLAMTPLPSSYVDVFAAGPGGRGSVDGDVSELDRLEGTILTAADGQMLGKVSRNRFDSESLMNSFGPYGSRYSSTSIFNQYGAYGSQYSALSPFNRYNTTPPMFVRDGKTVAYLSVNQYVSPRIDPQRLLAWLNVK